MQGHSPYQQFITTSPYLLPKLSIDPQQQPQAQGSPMQQFLYAQQLQQQQQMPMSPSGYQQGAKGSPKFVRGDMKVQIYTADASDLVTDAVSMSAVEVSLKSKIDGGFFINDEAWTCYRRNYFHASASLHLASAAFGGHQSQEADGFIGIADGSQKMYVQIDQDQVQLINGFSVGLSVKSNSGFENKTVELVHGTNRSHSTHLPAQSISPHMHATLEAVARRMSNRSSDADISHVNDEQRSSSTQANFQRLQFRSATANNGKRRAIQQRFILVLSLYAQLENGTDIEIGAWESEDVVVRGRSPGHYADQELTKGSQMLRSAHPYSPGTPYSPQSQYSRLQYSAPLPSQFQQQPSNELYGQSHLNFDQQGDAVQVYYAPQTPQTPQMQRYSVTGSPPNNIIGNMLNMPVEVKAEEHTERDESGFNPTSQIQNLFDNANYLM